MTLPVAITPGDPGWDVFTALLERSEIDECWLWRGPVKAARRRRNR